MRSIVVFPGGRAKSRSISFLRNFLIAVMLWSSLSVALGNTIFVTSTADSGVGTLRAALTNVNDGDIINAKGVSGTITLTNGELEVTNGVTILGPGPNRLTVNGNGAVRVMNLNIPSAQGVTIMGLTIANGASDNGGGIFNSTAATLTLSNCAFAENSAEIGGAVFNNSSDTGLVLTVINCSFANNSGSSGAGAISAECADFGDLSQLFVTNSVFTGNVGGGFGDAIDSYGNATIVGSTFVHNGTGGYSHVIENAQSGQAWVSDCLVSNNSSTAFGNCAMGVENSATLIVTNCAVIENEGLFGGAFYNGSYYLSDDYWGDASTYVYNCNVSDNFSSGNGGAFYNRGTGNFTSDPPLRVLVVVDTVVSNNEAAGFGGAFYNCGTNVSTASTYIENCTLFDNISYSTGGGIFNDGQFGGLAKVLVASSTLYGNNALRAGAIGDLEDSNGGQAWETIINCTFVRNYASEGYGGIYHEGVNEDASNPGLYICSTIFEKDGSPGNNVTVSNPSSAVSLGHDLCDDAGGGVLKGPGDVNNQIAFLGPLRDNGGPTPTCMPALGGPAYNNGLNVEDLPTDQRGFPRTVELCFGHGVGSDGTDIGAVERNIMTNIVVLNTNDDENEGSLRSAIEDANFCTDVNTITFAPGVSGTVTLSLGALSITHPVVLIGPGANQLTIDGNSNSTVFTVSSGVNTTIAGLTISHGTGNSGGGIFNDHATLTVSNCAFNGNHAQFGGAIYNASTFSGSSTLTVIGSTFSLNTAGDTGGAIYNDGESGNATLTVVNSTFSTNSAVFTAGGIYDDGFGGLATAFISASTFSGNSEGDADGVIFAEGIKGTGTVTIADCLLGSSGPGANLFSDNGTIASLGYNLSTDDGAGFLNGPADQINTDPQLGPLQNNGGPTCTYALPLSSPAIDKGKNVAGVTIDQRGAARTVDLPGIANAAGGDGTDIGAVESFPAPVYTVINLNDSGAGSLRQAILDATAFPDTNNIVFDPSLSGTITLTSGELPVTSFLNILGPGANNVAVSGNCTSRVFSITSGLNVTIAGLTIENGTNLSGGGIFNDHSILTVSNCALSGNSSSFGGGIYNNGDFSSGSSAALFIQTSTFSGNISGDEGGAIYNDGEFGSASATVLNSTFSGNSDISGGAAIWIAGTYGISTVTVSASTFSGNATDNPGGGGIHLEGPSGHAVLSIGDSILNAGVASANLDNNGGTVTSLGYNLISDGGGGLLNGPADQLNTNPRLGPLQNNGGSTMTLAPLMGSPVIDQGKANAVTSLAATTDQRGVSRPIDQPGVANAAGGDGSDIGAVEAQFAASVPILLGSLEKLSNGSFQLSFTNNPGAGFVILTSTNLALPLSSWTVLGTPVEISSGHFQYMDLRATNRSQSFYQIRSLY